VVLGLADAEFGLQKLMHHRDNLLGGNLRGEMGNEQGHSTNQKRAYWLIDLSSVSQDNNSPQDSFQGLEYIESVIISS
jgi:hypothetical protein